MMSSIRTRIQGRAPLPERPQYSLSWPSWAGWLSPEMSRISSCCGAYAERHRAKPRHPSVTKSVCPSQRGNSSVAPTGFEPALPP